MISHLQPSPRQMKHPSGHDGAGIPKWCLQIQRTPSKKDMSPNLGSHCQKERVFKPRFFPWNMLLFDLFGGITIFQTPHGFSIVILYMQAYKWTQIRTTRIHGLLSRPHFEILQIQEPWKRHTSCFCWTSFAGFWSMRPWAQIFAGCQEM